MKFCALCIPHKSKKETGKNHGKNDKKLTKWGENVNVSRFLLGKAGFSGKKRSKIEYSSIVTIDAPGNRVLK